VADAARDRRRTRLSALVVVRVASATCTDDARAPAGDAARDCGTRGHARKRTWPCALIENNLNNNNLCLKLLFIKINYPVLKKLIYLYLKLINLNS
jgi:hypothetical protein